MPPPAKGKVDYPYTGCYQFVPTLQSKEWLLHKIFQLATVHVKICDNLKAIYVQNLQDIRNEIGPRGHTLMQGFLGMQHEIEEQGKISLIHSVHNTGRPNIKAVLVPAGNYNIAIDQLATMHQGLLSGVPPSYHKNVFVDVLEVSLTSAHRDTIQPCNSSQHANELLIMYNPQDCEAVPQESKRFKPTLISYAAAVSSPSTTSVTQPLSRPGTTVTQTTISSLTDQDLDQLYEQFKHRVKNSDGTSPGITSEEPPKRVQDSNTELQQVRDAMRMSVEDLAAPIDNINIAVKKQNTVIAGLQITLEMTSKDIRASVDRKFDHLSKQINAMRDTLQSLLPNLTLQAANQSMGQAGE